MKFMLLTHHYSSFQVQYEGTKLVLDWEGPIDFTGAELIGLTNVHIFPLRTRKNPHSAVIQANFIQPTLYNPQKVLTTLRLDPHSDSTPLCNYTGKTIFEIIRQLVRAFDCHGNE